MEESKLDNSSVQSGIRNSIAGVLNDPMVKGILKNMVNNVFDTHGIPTANSLPGTAPKDVQNTIATIVTNPTFAQTVADISTYFSGIPADVTKATPM